ncbi:MAG TPA: TVP38/TMEM64 family protein [Clostridia bacterium]|nr:TVP38/TMEM64 family protein [Clostridia bacterium]
MDMLTGFIKEAMTYISEENLVAAIEYLRGFGFVLGIGLVSIEAFLPFLPLVLFVTVNVFVFGFVWGYVYSWIGTSAGTILVFLLLRNFGNHGLFNKIYANDKTAGRLVKIRERGFAPFFLLYCFPFTPSFLVSFIAALSDLSTERFVAATLAGKLVMIFFLSIIGYNFKAIYDNPVRSILLITLMLLIGYVSKLILERYEKKHYKF